jgi:urea transport system substrate-binding protein
LAMRPLLAAARNIVYRGARGPVTVRNGRARMAMHLAEADGLDFRLIKPI